MKLIAYVALALLQLASPADCQPFDFAQGRPPTANRRIIVELRAESIGRLRRDLQSIAATSLSKRTPSIRRVYSVTISGAALDVDPSMLPGIAKLPYVVSIQPDKPVRALSEGASYAAPIGAPPLRIGSRGEGVTIAVIDSGVDYTHPALGGGFGPGFTIAGGYDFVNGDADPRDDNGHGTHVAGIIAADSDEMTGIAPAATLLAYKVLDAGGFGSESDVIAALERAVDPNGDGDVSDHADVANLSLGGAGTPDDAQSRAVDAAVAAGVIVCVAAGNEGASFAILSPGTARKAITVGALDEDGRIAAFSSRGPCVRLASIKPDVVAPGVKIRSTFVGGGFATLDGTSMATPHVSGACALVHARHRAWTTAQVKAAITSTAIAVDGDALAEGGGRVDVDAASTTSLLASDSHFSFGLDAEQGGRWRRSLSITVTNIASDSSVYAVSATTSDPAISVRARPSVLPLAAGTTGTVTLSIVVDNDAAYASAPAFAHVGVMTLASEDRSVHFAWAVVQASRAVLTVDQPYGAFYVFSRDAMRQPIPIADNAAEMYVTAGEYELAAAGHEMGESGLPRSVAFVSMATTIAGDVIIPFTKADAPHRIVLRGTDERGVTLAGRDDYLARFRVYTPPLTSQRGVELLSGDGVLSISDLRDGFTIKAAEIGVDSPANRIVALQYPALDAIANDVTLAAGAVDLKRQRMQFVDRCDAPDRQICIYSVAVERATQFDPLALVAVAVLNVQSSSWSGDLYANEEALDDHIMATALQSMELGHAAGVTTSALRVRNGRFIASFEIDPSPLLYAAADGEVVTYGEGPALVVPHVVASSASLHACVRIAGDAGETLPRALDGGRFTVTDGEGNVVVAEEGFSIDVARPPNVVQVDFTTGNLFCAERPMRATLSARIDTTSVDAVPAALTSIAVLDGAGRMTSTLQAGHAAALLFTAADSTRTGAYRSVSGEATRVWFRHTGTEEWLPLTPVQLREDEDLGIQFRADLAPAATRGGTTVDLRITVADAAGNATTLTLEPAFAVETTIHRRRAVRQR